MFFTLFSFLALSLTTSALSVGLAIPRERWTVNADSQHAGNEAKLAIDGDPNTFWITETDPIAPCPHTFQIDMQDTYLVNGLSYLPRQDDSNDGNIGQHLIYLSTNGVDWGAPVVMGTYRNAVDKSTHYTTFVGRPARYLTLQATTEAQNMNYNWTSIAEFNVHRVPERYTDRTGWKVTADSVDSEAATTAQLAIDDKAYTFWHTEYHIQPNPPHPHTFTIDQGTVQSISGLSYVPRRLGLDMEQYENGRIGKYRVETSVDGNTWKEVATGTWADDYVEKGASFNSVDVRYVRLVALSEAGNRGPWTSAGEINLMAGNSLAEYQPPSASKGLWSHTIDFPLVPAAGANIHTTGEIMVWSAYTLDQFTGPTDGRTQAAIWNPVDGRMTQEDIAQTNHDMFCPGISLDAAGRIIVTGGNNAQKTSVLDPRGVSGKTWEKARDMNIPRGYQSSATLSDGRIFQLGGSWGGDRGQMKTGEVYDVQTNAWKLLPGCRTEPMLTQDRQGMFRSDNHAWLFAWSNTSVLQTGPSVAMNWYNAEGTGSHVAAGRRANDVDSMNGVAVMYDAIKGQIFTAGGSQNYQTDAAHANAHIITIKGLDQNPDVYSLPPMAYARGFASAVALPDGRVLVSGGQTWVEPFTDDAAVYVPELWDPRDNSFTKMNPHATPRTYHSMALLMPDGTVLHAGGGLCGNCATNHFDGEIFVPPYLLNDNGTKRTRPNITNDTPVELGLGASLQITTDTPITSIALMRLGSATHTVNTDQRRLPFDVPAGTSQTITIPRDPGVALPGHYMLFALDAAGTPSIARNIHITAADVPTSPDRFPHLDPIHVLPDPPPQSNLLALLGVQVDGLLGLVGDVLLPEGSPIKDILTPVLEPVKELLDGLFHP